MVRPHCPFCYSENVLPFEDDSKKNDTDSLPLILISALILVVGYFVFIISTYLFLPLVVFIAIVVLAIRAGRIGISLFLCGSVSPCEVFLKAAGLKAECSQNDSQSELICRPQFVILIPA